MRRFLFLAALLATCLWAIPANATGAVKSIDQYRLDAGDKIKINVTGEPDLKLETRLDSSGEINYPFLGKIHVSGMTVSDLENMITKGLSNGYLVSPQVQVTIVEFRPFYVNGEVNKPGAYPYQPGMNVRKAISVAGGFNSDADAGKLFLIHAGDTGKHEVKVSMSDTVGPGDTVIIKESFFFVNGEVNKPGKFVFRPGTTYRMAISQAGGFTKYANEDKVDVIHVGSGQHTHHVDNIDTSIRPGDVITVEQSLF